MSSVLSPEIMQSLREEVKKALVEMIPGVIKELTPVVLDIIKVMAPVIVDSTREHTTHIQEMQRTAEETKLKHGEIFKEFTKRHTTAFNELMEEKKKWLQRYLTLTWQLELYDEYLASGESYIPREYRKDDYYVHDEEELASVIKFEAQRFRSEYEIMAKRRKFMLEKVENIDESAKKIINDENIPEEVKDTATKRWFDFSKEYMKPMEAEVVKKKQSTIEANNKDKEFYKKHQLERLKNRKQYDSIEKKDTRSERSKPAVTPKNTERREGAFKSPTFELVVVNKPAVPEQEGNIVNMSGLEDIDFSNDPSRQSKNLGGETLRRSSRISLTSHEKT